MRLPPEDRLWMRSRDVVACILGAVDGKLGGGGVGGSMYQSEFGTGKTGTRTLMNMRDTFQAGLDAMEANEAGMASFGALGGQSPSQAGGAPINSQRSRMSGGLGSGKTGTRTLMNMRQTFQEGLDALQTQSPGQGNQVLSGLGGPQAAMMMNQQPPMAPDGFGPAGANLDQLQGQQPMQQGFAGGTPMMPMGGMGGSQQGMQMQMGGSQMGSMGNPSPTPGAEFPGTPAGSQMGPPQPANEWQQALLSASQQGGSVQ